MIYVDNAATSLIKPDSVAQAVAHAMNSFGDAARGCHAASLSAGSAIYNARIKAAELFSAGIPERVAFTANATESLNMAINGMFRTGDHIITTACEHNSVLRPLFRAKGNGVGMSVIPLDPAGYPEYDSIKSLIKRNTRAIICSNVSNVTGNLIDIEMIAKLCREQGLMFVLDAALSAGLYDISMTKTGIDVLCFTGHKYLLGPQGVGGICVRDGITVSPTKVGGMSGGEQNPYHPRLMPDVLEAGTLNAHGIAGLFAGMLYIDENGISNLRRQADEFARAFCSGISGIPGVVMYGDPYAYPHAPIVAFNVGDLDSERAAAKLDIKYGIAARGGLHNAPLLHKAFGTEKRGMLRVSFSCFNTMGDVDALVRAVSELAK